MSNYLGISKQCEKCKAYFFTDYETDTQCNDCMPQPEAFNSWHVLSSNPLSKRERDYELLSKMNTEIYGCIIFIALFCFYSLWLSFDQIISIFNYLKEIPSKIYGFIEFLCPVVVPVVILLSVAKLNAKFITYIYNKIKQR